MSRQTHHSLPHNDDAEGGRAIDTHLLPSSGQDSWPVALTASLLLPLWLCLLPQARSRSASPSCRTASTCCSSASSSTAPSPTPSGTPTGRSHHPSVHTQFDRQTEGRASYGLPLSCLPTPHLGPRSHLPVAVLCLPVCLWPACSYFRQWGVLDFAGGTGTYGPPSLYRPLTHTLNQSASVPLSTCAVEPIPRGHIRHTQAGIRLTRPFLPARLECHAQWWSLRRATLPWPAASSSTRPSVRGGTPPTPSSATHTSPTSCWAPHSSGTTPPPSAKQ